MCLRMATATLQEKVRSGKSRGEGEKAADRVRTLVQAMAML